MLCSDTAVEGSKSAALLNQGNRMNEIKELWAALADLCKTCKERFEEIRTIFDGILVRLDRLEMVIETELPAQDGGWMSQVLTQANKDEARCIECGESDGKGWVIGAFAENMFPCGACNDQG